MYIYLFIYLIYLCFIYLFRYLFIYLGIYYHYFTYLFIHLFIYPHNGQDQQKHPTRLYINIWLVGVYLNIPSINYFW